MELAIYIMMAILIDAFGVFPFKKTHLFLSPLFPIILGFIERKAFVPPKILLIDEVFESDTIDVQLHDFFKRKPVSRCKDEFLNVLCEESDDEPLGGEGEHAPVESNSYGEVDDEKDTEESSEEDSDEDQIEYSIHDLKVKWNVIKPVLGERYESRHQLILYLTNYSIHKGYKIRFKKCDSVRLVVVCESDPEKCPFYGSCFMDEYC
ncbi:unnamed protein product [Lactuca virosa]|uniref:Transposase MuDR plant domain-containing protein n=1 Tax=Lactuca virosa TaxID=75947 RepID=A0AAU9LHZ2_9ASTR|nr:unnamed protein product [Lactuca virosa]